MVATERRSSTRVRAYRPVRLRKSNPTSLYETLTKELSAQGMRCLSPTWFPVSSELAAELVLSDGEPPISAVGRSVWFRVVPHSDQFEVGFSLHGISYKDKRRLSVYLERLSATSSSI